MRDISKSILAQISAGKVSVLINQKVSKNRDGKARLRTYAECVFAKKSDKWRVEGLRGWTYQKARAYAQFVFTIRTFSKILHPETRSSNAAESPLGLLGPLNPIT